jgi:hypothetical protein
MLIAVINQSTRVTNADVDTMTKAVQKQMTLHVAPAWNQKTPTVKFYADQTKIPGYAWVVTMLDNYSQAGVLGYHSEDNDKVDAFIFASPVLDNGGVVLYDSNNPQNVSVASVLSHEVCEMFIDRFANEWADGPVITQGNQYAKELCDPVEADSYAVQVKVGLSNVNVSVSNFIFPSWFNPQGDASNLPFDYLKKLTAPFTMTAGGYMIVDTSSNEQQVFGHAPGTGHHDEHVYKGANGRNLHLIMDKAMPEWRKEQVKSEWYRR